MAGLYLLLRRHNAIAPQITSPMLLRRWAAAFLFATAASHVWWTVLSTVWLVDDRVVRNIINLSLDRLTFMPLMMVMLLRMLQVSFQSSCLSQQNTRQHQSPYQKSPSRRAFHPPLQQLSLIHI